VSLEEQGGRTRGLDLQAVYRDLDARQPKRVDPATAQMMQGDLRLSIMWRRAFATAGVPVIDSDSGRESGAMRRGGQVRAASWTEFAT